MTQRNEAITTAPRPGKRGRSGDGSRQETPSVTQREDAAAKHRVPLPMAALLALFMAGFLGILNETVPAGLLPEMSKSLGVSESAAGQTITVYALATALTAIPLNAAMKTWDRRTLLISALVVFTGANAVAALVSSFPVLLIARTVAGVGAGLIWSNIGGTAARIVPKEFQGKAIAIAMAGIPAALSLGLPAGTLLGDSAGWHATFGVMAAAAAGLIVWMIIALPSLPGEGARMHVPVATILRTPGVRPIVAIVAGYMIAHNLLYTYIGPLTVAAGIGDQIEFVLLVFGVAALLSIFAVGTYMNPHHRRLMVGSTIVVATSALALRFAIESPVVLYLAAAAWGFGFGGSATLFVTAGIRASGTDGIQSILVTVFNLSIAAGGVVGGLLLAWFGVSTIPVVAFAIMIPTVIATYAGRRHAFPSWSEVGAA